MSKEVLDRYNSKVTSETGERIHFDPFTMQYYYDQRLDEEGKKGFHAALRRIIVTDALALEMVGVQPKGVYHSPYIPMDSHDIEVDSSAIEYAVLR